MKVCFPHTPGERTCERAEEEDAGHTASRDCLDNEWDAVEGGRKDPKVRHSDMTTSPSQVSTLRLKQQTTGSEVLWSSAA